MQCAHVGHVSRQLGEEECPCAYLVCSTHAAEWAARVRSVPGAHPGAHHAHRQQGRSAAARGKGMASAQGTESCVEVPRQSPMTLPARKLSVGLYTSAWVIQPRCHTHTGRSPWTAGCSRS